MASVSTVAPQAVKPRSERRKTSGARLSTARLARLSAHHPWAVVLTWLVIVALGGFLAQGLGDALTTQVTMTNEPESVRADTLLETRFRPFEPVTETVVIRSESATVDDAAFKEVVGQTVAALNGMPEIVASTSNYYDVLAQDSAAAGGLISPDRHALIVPVTLVGEFDDAAEHAEEYIAAIDGQKRDGFEVLTVGDVSSDHTYGTMAESDLRTGEAIGVPVALIVLVVVFGALVAAGLPLVLGAVAIVVALGMTAIVGEVLDLFVFVTNVITMLGLAVGIDYSLFVVARYREERRRGADKLAAIELAGATASKAVLFSGSTVVLALAGMLFVPLTVFQSIGIASILVVVSAILATLTLIPALLALLGDRIDWPRRHKGERPVVARTTHVGPTGGFWDGLTRVVMARPVISVVGAILILVSLAIPAFDLNRGMSTVDSLPESDVKSAYLILAQDFSAGLIDPVEIVVDGRRDDPAVQAGIANLGALLEQDAAFGMTPRVAWNEAGDLGLLEVDLVMNAYSDPAYDAIDRLRADLVPAAFAGTEGVEVLVTGGTAQISDFFRSIDDVTPWVFAFVLGLSFVLLTIVFRSIVVPIKAILMNLLSVGAAYGLLVLVFQKGHGDELLGMTRTTTIEAWLPIFLFCILFGLSMDYHVFLLSRIREHYDLTGNNREAVATGLRTTARIITGAALIMVVVFGGFAAGRLAQLQEMGFGLAVAVFLDATLVRTVLVPAAMELLGDRNWYLPRWLHWLPDLRIDGEPAGWP